MKLRDYLRIARRRWVFILGIAAVVVAAAAMLTSQMTPQYASSARVFISTTPSTSSDAYQGGLFSEQRVSSYADLLSGSELAQRVIDDLDLDLSSTDLAGKIKATVIPDTVVLGIRVTDPSAVEAQRINTAVVEQLKKFVAELETPPGGGAAVLKATTIDPPRLLTSPVSPRPTLNIGLAMVMGLLAGLGLAALRELLDSSVKNIEDIPALTTTPVISSLSFDPETAKHPLISTLPSHAPRAEAFRVMRTNLQFIDVDARSKSFVVTSSVPGEGKSTTSTNIAIALAQDGQRVLLVDADLRRPQVARMLSLENAVGVTNVLVGQIELDDALQMHASSGLTVLTSGAVPPNPAELISSNAMAELLADLRARFDVIVIDAPALLSVTDSALLASQTDGALLVIHHGKTTKGQVKTAVDRLAQVDGSILGVVFNMVPDKGALDDRSRARAGARRATATEPADQIESVEHVEGTHVAEPEPAVDAYDEEYDDANDESPTAWMFRR